MRVYLWLVALANLAAHGWTILVLLGTAKTLGDATLMAKNDSYIIFWLDAGAGVLTLGLVVALLMGKGVRKAAPPKPSSHWIDPPKPPAIWATPRDRTER